MADLNQAIAINPRTVFYIASTSKQFTAMSIALLAEQGRISLDDPVRKYVPELPDYASGVRIHHLVHHTSGIRDYLGLWGLSGRSFADEVPEAVALDLIARQRALDFEPGSRWSYSNSGYFLLSLIVKRVTHGSLRQFADENIFKPLRMLDTHFHDDKAMIVPRRAEGYEPDRAGGFHIVRTSFALVGDGGLLTTIEDLAKWDENFYHNVLGTRGQALIDQVTESGRLNSGEPTRYGFGLFGDEYRGLKTVEHGGSFIGYRAELLRFPSEHTSIGILCNDYTANPSQMAHRVTDIVLADRLSPAQATAGKGEAGVSVPAAALDRLAGRYEVGPGFVVEFRRGAGGLEAVLGGNPIPLTARADTAFTNPSGGEIVFGRGAKGEPTVLAKAFGMDRPAPKLGPVPVLTDADRQALVGRYASDELDTVYEIATKGDALEVRARLGEWRPLKPQVRDAFTEGGAKLEFDRDKRGAVTGFRLSAARSQNIRFVRVNAPPAR
jgi:CubicO group peptidase (beta-lactamase class C family)